ncbi:MAG: PIG-L family deacetylase [Lachnospiraceae bacterium]|nr:PIG-L family deacetylase [Lachnospiraceae bacterium]MCI9134703.1 PIG-L family deacetylase [Lachnospiraceae bacterium]
MKVLVVCAHPDDAEISCGGTLAKYARQGHRVSIMHVCTGDKGHKEIMPEELGPVRCREAQLAGAVIGAKVISLGFPDAGIFYTEENVKRFTEAIRREEPDLIITHTPDDYHLDHAAVSKLVIDASFLVSVPHYAMDVPAMEGVPQIYFMEPYTGINFVPSEFVDITETLELKLAMMGKHESQTVWIREHDDLDILDMIRTSAKFRGYQCKKKYAEGFVRYINALRAEPGRFLP